MLKQRVSSSQDSSSTISIEHHRDYITPPAPGFICTHRRIAEDYSNMSARRGGGLNPHETLARMAAGAGTRYDPALMQLFINLMGRYPPGTLLDVEIPLTVGTHQFVLMSSSLVREPESFDKPLCRLIQLPDGTDCPPSYAGKVIDLMKRPHRIISVRSQI